MRAYNKERAVLCITKWQDFGTDKKSWRVFGGAKTKDELTVVADELGITWDS